MMDLRSTNLKAVDDVFEGRILVMVLSLLHSPYFNSRMNSLSRSNRLHCRHHYLTILFHCVVALIVLAPTPTTTAFTPTKLFTVHPYQIIRKPHFHHDESYFTNIYTTTGKYKHHNNIRNPFLLTTTSKASEGDDPKSGSNPNRLASILSNAKSKFQARPGTYLLIPCIAALVGWFTNYLAVQMIFYPINYWGISLWRRPEVPLGLIGWQGIVPCKTRSMSRVMVDMVTSQLLSVPEAFGKLHANTMATLLAPRVPMMAMDLWKDLVVLPNEAPRWLLSLPPALLNGLSDSTQSIMQHFNIQFLQQFIRSIQDNIESVFSIQDCVQTQMLQDRRLLGQLFQQCGQKELDFLTNSGLWFGFLLGVIQMMVALVWDNPWSLSIGGAIVGLATNWLALKWIFEPVEPTRFGPFVLQGQFLRRQKEVSETFSHFFATRILTSQQMWHSILTNPNTRPAFCALFAQHFERFVSRITRGLLQGTLDPRTLQLLTTRAIEQLPQHVTVLHGYIDKTLDLEQILRTRMNLMTSAQFERVLHPIFEEDELTLILAGAVLGFAAGLIQQGLETGYIRLDMFRPGAILKRLRKQGSKLKRRLRNLPEKDDDAIE